MRLQWGNWCGVDCVIFGGTGKASKAFRTKDSVNGADGQETTAVRVSMSRLSQYL